MEINLRVEAKTKKLTYYFTGQKCKYGHVAVRQTSNGKCMECQKLIRPDSDRRYREKYPDKNKEWHHNHRDYHNEQCRQWRLRNPGYQAKKTKEWYENNPDWLANYFRDNKDRYNAHHARRRALKFNATPEWLTTEDYDHIAALYEDAKKTTEQYGIEYAVDHDIPLQGDIVTGLHVPDNLRVITDSENSSKSNRFDQDKVSESYFIWLKDNGL